MIDLKTMTRTLFGILILVSAVVSLKMKESPLQGQELSINDEKAYDQFGLSWSVSFDLVTSYGCTSEDNLFLIPQGSQSVSSVRKHNGAIDWHWFIRLSMCRMTAHQHNGVHCFLVDHLEYSEKSSVVVGGMTVDNKYDHVMLYGLNATNGYLLWFQVLPNDGPTFSFAVHEDVVAMTSYLGGVLTGVNTTNGHTLWTLNVSQCPEPVALKAEPSLKTFIYSCQKRSNFIKADTGKIVQTLPMGNEWAYSHNVQKFYTVVDSILYAISHVDNEILWKLGVDIFPGFKLIGTGNSGEILAGYRPNSGDPSTYLMTSYLSDGTPNWTLPPMKLSQGSNFSQKISRVILVD